MKAVIVDLQGQKAAALCEDGSVREIPDAGYTPGQTIELPVFEISAADLSSDEKIPSEEVSSGRDRRRHRLPRAYMRQIAAAAAACFLVLGIGTGTVWAMPYGKVYVDNGSTISYTINRFDYVLEVDADSEAGQEVLDELDLKKIVHKKIDTAVEQTIEQMEQNAGKDKAESASGAADAGEIEITTEIKNEKHAEMLKERLRKITVEAADAATAQTKDREQAGSPEEVGGSGAEKSGNGTDAGNPEKGQIPADQKGLPDENAFSDTPGGMNSSGGEEAGSEADSKTDSKAGSEAGPAAGSDAVPETGSADKDASELTPGEGENPEAGSKPAEDSSDQAPSSYDSGEGASGTTHGQPPQAPPAHDDTGRQEGGGSGPGALF